MMKMDLFSKNYVNHLGTKKMKTKQNTDFITSRWLNDNEKKLHIKTNKKSKKFSQITLLTFPCADFI